MQEPRQRKYVVVVDRPEPRGYAVDALISWGLFGAAAAMVVVTALFCG